MTTKQQPKKPGRPARDKQSLFSEIQRLKARLDVANNIRRGYEDELERAYDTIVANKTASLGSRLKYVIKKEL